MSETVFLLGRDAEKKSIFRHLDRCSVRGKPRTTNFFSLSENSAHYEHFFQSSALHGPNCEFLVHFNLKNAKSNLKILQNENFPTTPVIC